VDFDDELRIFMALSGNNLMASSPLACFVARRLTELGLRPIEFARQHHFDQGMLSKILTSVKTNLELETALRLAEGLQVPASDFLSLLGKEESHDLIRRLYLAQSMDVTKLGFNTLVAQKHCRIADARLP